jgi:hypothetical protein
MRSTHMTDEFTMYRPSDEDDGATITIHRSYSGISVNKLGYQSGNRVALGYDSGTHRLLVMPDNEGYKMSKQGVVTIGRLNRRLKQDRIKTGRYVATAVPQGFVIQLERHQ